MKEDETGDIAYADAETADQAGRRDYSMRSCRMTKEILAKRGLMNEYLRMSEGRCLPSFLLMMIVHAGGIIRKVIEQDKVFVKCEKLQ